MSVLYMKRQNILPIRPKEGSCEPLDPYAEGAHTTPHSASL
jgi:hypothetical protein